MMMVVVVVVVDDGDARLRAAKYAYHKRMLGFPY